MIDHKIQENIDLSRYTTFRIGGRARFLVEVISKEEVIDALVWAENHKSEVLILGGGSNILINDDGWHGLVVKLKNDAVSIKGQRIEAGAGAGLSKVVVASRGNDLTGLEWAIGIPGSVGGAIRGNAGANGSDMSASIETVEVFDLEQGIFKNFSRNECQFGYRDSIFKQQPQFLIWQVVLKLESGRASEEQILEMINKRQNTQPRLPNAGCVFKNISIGVPSEKLLQLLKQDDLMLQEKISAGWLIEKLELKGVSRGGAKISLEHANFIVNTGSATAADVIYLINLIKTKAEVELGVKMEEEIQII